MNSFVSIAGTEVRIRPVMSADMPVLQMLETTGVRLAEHDGVIPSPATFQEWLWRNTLVRCMIIRGKEFETVGTAFSYNADLRNGCANIGLAVRSDTRAPLSALVGLGLFISYVFASWPLRCLYAMSREYNFAGVTSGQDKIFTSVGRLKMDTYDGERYWDTLIVRIDRNSWEDGIGRQLAKKMRRADDGRAGMS